MSEETWKAAQAAVERLMEEYSGEHIVLVRSLAFKWQQRKDDESCPPLARETLETCLGELCDRFGLSRKAFGLKQEAPTT
jgi:hypothetical protein